MQISGIIASVCLLVKEKNEAKGVSEICSYDSAPNRLLCFVSINVSAEKGLSHK